ncbi:MAG: hypothetical protein R3291_03455 [Thermoplasmata archaeon]|nr:hypothetical protein [Thermoplasmata archaeon]
MGKASVDGAGAFVVVDRLGSGLEGLTSILPRRRRRHLAEAMLMDVFQALRESRLVQTIVLGTRQPEAAAVGRRADVPVVDAMEADDDPADGDAPRLSASLWGDLPLLEGQDLAFLIGRAARQDRLVLVPTPGGEGLSLAVTRERGFMKDLGTGTLASWRRESTDRGLATEVYATPAGMRPSTAEDLLQVYMAARLSRAKRLLKEWRMGPTLKHETGAEG